MAGMVRSLVPEVRSREPEPPPEVVALVTRTNSVAPTGVLVPTSDWKTQLAQLVEHELQDSSDDLMDRLTRQFEQTVIEVALRHTRGRRIEAAQKLGIGRNTITRKIQELGLDSV